MGKVWFLDKSIQTPLSRKTDVLQDVLVSGDIWTAIIFQHGKLKLTVHSCYRWTDFKLFQCLWNTIRHGCAPRRTFPWPRLLCAAGGPKMLRRTSSGAVPIGFVGSQPFPKPFWFFWIYVYSNLEEQGLLHFIFSCAIVGMRTFPSPRLLCAAGGPKMLWRTSSGAVPIGFIGSQPFPKPFWFFWIYVVIWKKKDFSTSFLAVQLLGWGLFLHPGCCVQRVAQRCFGGQVLELFR